jgi:hypothetical protein
MQYDNILVKGVPGGAPLAMDGRVGAGAEGLRAGAGSSSSSSWAKARLPVWRQARRCGVTGLPAVMT